LRYLSNAGMSTLVQECPGHASDGQHERVEPAWRAACQSWTTWWRAWAGVVGGGDAAVVAEPPDGGAGVAAAELGEGLTVDRIALAAVLGEGDGGEAPGECCVGAAGFDLGELAGTPTSTTLAWAASAWASLRASLRVPTIPASSSTTTARAGRRSPGWARSWRSASRLLAGMLLRWCSSAAARGGQGDAGGVMAGGVLGGVGGSEGLGPARAGDAEHHVDAMARPSEVAHHVRLTPRVMVGSAEVAWHLRSAPGRSAGRAGGKQG
jgi:hypothetical protein